MTTPLALAPLRRRHQPVNLVPSGYRGWVKITTPCGRVKVRYVRDGLVYRDNKKHEPANPQTVETHALACRIEPCQVIT